MIYDYLVIGAGISGASVASELTSFGSVAILEAESVPGYHSTGRSAALFTPNYGPELVRKISRLSHSFLSSPPDDFAQVQLLSPRGMMSVAMNQPSECLNSLVAGSNGEIELVDKDYALSLAPFLDPDKVTGGAYEKAVDDIDVDALHQGFLKAFSRQGGQLRVGLSVSALTRKHGVWEVHAGGELFQSRVVINAAGAWVDKIAMMADINPISISARRRSAILVQAPEEIDLKYVPALDFVGVENYIKPEKSRLMISPGDAMPVEPQDIQVDDFDIAVLVDWIESSTSINVNKVEHQWAGLRCFVTDGHPVVGYDRDAEGFFWLAGQGGYGIMMASSLARASAELIVHDSLPKDFIDAGIRPDQISPCRLS